MSEPLQDVQRWEAPSFEKPRPATPRATLAELEEEARAKGFAHGKQEGMEAVQEEAQEITAVLQSILEHLSQPFEKLDQLVVQELVQTVMLIVRQIVRRELNTDSSVVEQYVIQALATLSNMEEPIEIYLNPQDVELINQVAGVKLENKDWKIIEDPKMMPGGCSVKSRNSYVNASVERQLEMIFNSLSESLENTLDKKE